MVGWLYALDRSAEKGCGTLEGPADVHSRCRYSSTVAVVGDACRDKMDSRTQNAEITAQKTDLATKVYCNLIT